jgi:6-phosphogluconolactonase
MEERSFKTIEAAAYALADDIAATLRDAILSRGQALLAVSGGRTPQHVFEHLRGQNVDWDRVTLTLTDERWVRPDHPDSNEELVRSYLLQGSASQANFIPLFGGEESPLIGESSCEARLREMALPFDAVYLGMGGDGHFASLFPNEAAVSIHDRYCVGIPATDTRFPRMSLTVPTILNSRKLFLLFSGAEKNAIYAEAKKPGSYKDIPLRYILLQSKTPLYVMSSP